MAVTQVKVQEILDILRNLHPGWNSFSQPSFAREEVTYKQKTIAKARELLSESEFSRLLQAGEFGEIINRLEVIGRDNNLLWINIPASGDLSILYQPGLDKATFCQAVFDLLYGPGASPMRLERYMAYVIDHGLPNKWTFPTYYLFMVHPDTELDTNTKPQGGQQRTIFSRSNHTRMPRGAAKPL